MTLPEPSLAVTTPTASVAARRSHALASKLPSLVLFLMVAVFTVWFALYSIRLHEAQLTNKADLGQIDLAIWNTAHGRFVQEVVGDHISTRLTDHVEPIFAPLSLIFWIWDDVRALLAAQALALAIGALPVYWLARQRLAGSLALSGGSAAPNSGGNAEKSASIAGLHPRAGRFGQAAAWGGVAFAAAYLLAPMLQAAAVSEFHALALAPALVSWALWAAERRQWGRFVLAAVLVMAVQEGLALLGALLGAYVIAREGIGWRRHRSNGRSPGLGLAAGAIVCLVGLAWFYLTAFVIIPHFAAPAYGLDQTPYAARYGQLGDSFGDVIKSLLTRPGLVIRLLAEPLRLRYLLGLLVPTGFLALLAPEIVLLSLPLLLANMLSAFPFQYSGELHYSAPLVPYFMIAGALGLVRLIRWRTTTKVVTTETNPGVRNNDFSRIAHTAKAPRRNDFSRVARRTLWAGVILTLAGALTMQALAGYTPAGREFWRRAPAAWPPVTAHHRLLDRFLAQIPAGVPASTTAGLYPHLSHRELLYQFPITGQAQWALVDVAGTTDRHPAVIRSRIEELLAAGWGVVDAADGYVLLGQGQGAARLPEAFYDFARGGGPWPVAPAHKLDITFGNRLKLLGYDVLDEPKWRRTALRLYWQALEPLPDELTVNVQALAPDGSVAADTAQTPMPALVWYPPAHWRPGETIITETPPWYLPAAWAPTVAIQAKGQPWLAAGCQIYPDSSATDLDGYASSICAPDGLAQLPAWYRTHDRLSLAPSPVKFAQADARFAAPDWRVDLAAYHLPAGAPPGGQLPVQLTWTDREGNSPGPAPRDYTVFVHLRDTQGQTVANADATPTYFLPAHTTTWPGPTGAVRGPAGDVQDAHILAVPANLAPGRYQVAVGWYDWQTGERLKLLDGQGNAAGDEYVLGDVSIDPSQARSPDLACLLAPQACASQP
jgi:uncharacterized membrane protein